MLERSGPQGVSESSEVGGAAGALGAGASVAGAGVATATTSSGVAPEGRSAGRATVTAAAFATTLVSGAVEPPDSWTKPLFDWPTTALCILFLRARRAGFVTTLLPVRARRRTERMLRPLRPCTLYF